MPETEPQPRLGNVIGLRYDRAIDEYEPDDVLLSAYRPPGDGLALYITPVKYPADEFRVFVEPRDMLALAWALVVAAFKWRKNRPWDADMTPAEREESKSHAF